MWHSIMQFLAQPSVNQTLLFLTLVVATGVFLGNKLSVRGLSLGVTWVLFVGLFVSAAGVTILPEVGTFARDFGLVLFVYSLGLQAGPSFFSSFGNGGLRLNLLSVVIVLFGVGVMLLLQYFSGEDMATMVGVMAGAVTNTPSLGAAEQSYSQLHGTAPSSMAAGYALAYPFSVLGVILSIIIMRWLCRVDLQKEEQSLLKGDAQKDKEPVCVDVAINDENAGLTIAKLHHRCKADMVVSRVIHPDGTEEVAEGSTMLRNNDIVRILTDRAHLQQLETLGTISVFTRIPRGNTETLVSRRIVVTKSQWNGQKIGKVDIRAHYHVTITRVIRAGIDLLATPSLTLQLGDRLIAVGAEDDVKRVAELFGNELKRLDVPHLVPVFLGIALGVLVGLCPVVLPGLDQSFRLGLAGGTLVVALLMGRFGPVYKVVTFVTTSANRMLREVGLSLFLAAVGLNSGGSFLQAVAQGGYWWILYGLLITMLPLLIVGWVAYRLMHIDFFSVAGLFTGTMSDAPALAYAMSLSSGNDNASITYATVYPLTMFLRILAAQLIILLLC